MTEPRTAAGRALLDLIENPLSPDWAPFASTLDGILAIEAEAAELAGELDAERLAKAVAIAFDEVFDPVAAYPDRVIEAVTNAIAREYDWLYAIADGGPE